MSEVVRRARIRNRQGLHARPAAEFVKVAARFEAEVWVEKEDLEVNGKSIMGVLMLAAESGTEICIRATGDDADAAAAALVDLVRSGFGEELDDAVEPDDDADGGRVPADAAGAGGEDPLGADGAADRTS